MKHTLGPWKVVGTEIWAGSKRITIGRGSFDEKDREIRDANARLIASAPELLEACKTTEKYFSRLSYLEPEKYREIQSTWEIVSQAIAKAEGRKQNGIHK